MTTTKTHKTSGTDGLPTVVTTRQSRNIALVYQAGIANVFEISGDYATGERHRILQHAFIPCEWYAQGLRDNGNNLKVYSCNRAGDIKDAPWVEGMDDCPFRDSANPPKEVTGLKDRR